MTAFSFRFFAAVLSVAPLAVFPTAHAQTVPKAAAPALAPLTERMNEFPSLWQMDERAGFLGDGAKFCGPVAASNALLWLATHGFPRLLPGENGDTLYGGYAFATSSKTTKAQIALVHAITGDGFVKMREGSGSSPGYVARGVRAYVESKGYQVERLQIAPIVNDPPTDFPASAAASVLPIEAVKEAFQKGAAVWLAIGWYEKDGETNTYTRTGGHFVTLVGYGKDASGSVDDSVLIFRNPAQRAGRNYPNEFVRLQRMTSGTFPGRGGSLGHSVAGHFEVVGGLSVGARTTAILENATILVLKPAQ